MSGYSDTWAAVHMISFLMLIIIEIIKNASKKKVPKYLRIIPVAVLAMPWSNEFIIFLANIELSDMWMFPFYIGILYGVILGIVKDTSFRNLKTRKSPG